MGRFDEAYNPSVTFEAAASESSAADISTLGARGIAPRGNWEDWTTAQIGIQVSYDEDAPTNWVTPRIINDAGDGYDPLASPNPSSLDNGDPIEIKAQAWMLQNVHWIRLVSRDTSTFATPVAQSVEINIVIGTLA